jgi:hypothetical protein
MVSGEIGEKPLAGCGVGVLADGVALPVKSNPFATGWPDGAEEDFDVVNDCRASITEDAAPRASNMVKLRQTRPTHTFARSRSKHRASGKNADE